MSEPPQALRYERALLLAPKRNELLELWQVERYGRDSFSDVDHVPAYGLRPQEDEERVSLLMQPIPVGPGHAPPPARTPPCQSRLAGRNGNPPEAG